MCFEHKYTFCSSFNYSKCQFEQSWSTLTAAQQIMNCDSEKSQRCLLQIDYYHKIKYGWLFAVESLQITDVGRFVQR